MENTNVQEVKMPITYDDLKKSLVDSGRPYDFAMIDRAYALAEKAHGEQRRRSGEPYICHPLSVAQILVELGMDSESIAAALMHDVAEDTPVTVAEIKQKFGPEVALLVDGVTKLTQIKFSNVEDRQAENLRKMLLAMSQDVRVMIIKLCDRLHNMRTGDAWPEQKRRDKALETMEVYAPIAHQGIALLAAGAASQTKSVSPPSLWPGRELREYHYHTIRLCVGAALLLICHVFLAQPL